MRKWKYKLEFEGKILRDLINNGDETIENIIAIYKQTIKCLEAWKKKLTVSDKEDWKYDIELVIDDLECAIPDIEDKTLIYEDEQEKINYHLSDFYDICDYGRVFIGI